MELTTEEIKFISALKRATKKIPDRLWLFCSESGLHVMRRGENGERVFTAYEGVDQDYKVSTITEEVGSGAW